MSVQNQLALLTKQVDNLKNYSTSGDLSPHEAYLLIKESGIEDLFKDSLSEIKSQAIEHLKNNVLNQGEKTYKENGYSFTVRGGSTRYYFTDVKEVQEKKKQAESTEAYREYKSSEQKYKTAFLMKQKGQSIVDEETGEILDVSSVKVVYSPDTLSIKRTKNDS